MRVKTIYGWTEKTMDRRVNLFLNDPLIEVIDIKFASPVFFFSAMIMYKEIR